MKILIPIFIVIIFWLLDSYKDVLNFDIKYIDALLFNYPQATPILKTFIAIILFLFFTFFEKKQNEFKNEKAKNHLDTPILQKVVNQISDTILSPFKIDKKFNNIVDDIESMLDIETVIICSFAQDKLTVLNTNDSLKKYNINSEYKPYKENIKDKSLEKILSDIFLAKKDFDESFLTIGTTEYKLISSIYKDPNIHNKLGLVSILVNKYDIYDYTNFLSKVCELVAFSISQNKKMQNTQNAQNSLNEQFTQMDKELQIANNTKLQQVIQHEINRSKRYNSKLSLILIKIDYIKNLSNIFEAKDILALKKEFAQFFNKEVRDTDVFGKWNDDTFAIIAPDIDFRTSQSFAKRLNNILLAKRFTKVGKITCSYGITSLSPHDTIGNFRKRAEAALGEATKKGNSIEIKILV